MTTVSPGNTNLENVTLQPVDSDHESQYVPAGITTPEVINYPPGLVVFENIPASLRVRSQWVVWKIEPGDDGQLTKVPYRSNGKGKAGSTLPLTWSSFEDAKKAYEAGGYDGVAFVFRKGDRILGLDYDHNFDPDTKTFLRDREEILSMGSYAEFSPSGTGVHIYALGDKPGQRCKRGDYEMYDTARFFTVTGHHIEGTPKMVQEAPPDLINTFYSRLVEKRVEQPIQEKTVHPGDTELTDDEILEKLKNASNGSKFLDLWNGGNAGYPSPSEGDAALAAMIAFYTKNTGRIINIMMRSNRNREKWGRDDYMERTIEGASRIVSEQYTAQKKEKKEKKEKKDTEEKEEKKEEELPLEIVERAREIIMSGGAYKFMVDTITQNYVGGESNIKLHLASIGSQMCGNSDGGLSPNMTGETGSGKTTLQRNILHHLSPKYKADGARTQKAVLYADYRVGAVVFYDNLDEPDKTLTAIMNQRTMYFQERMPYEVTNLKEKNVMVKGLNKRVMLWVNGQDAAFEDAQLSRQLVLATDDGKVHSEKLKTFQMDRFHNGDAAFPVTDEVLTCRAIHELLLDEAENNPVLVKLDLLDDIAVDDPRGRTQVGDAIKGITAWSRYNRMVDEEGFIHADPADYDEVKGILKSAISSKCSKQELKILKMMMKHPSGITQRRLSELAEVSQPTISYCLEGRGGNGGLIQKLPGVITFDDTYIQDSVDDSMVDGQYKKTGRRTKIYYINQPDKVQIDGAGQVTLGVGCGDILKYHQPQKAL